MKFRLKKTLCIILAAVLLFSTVESAFAEGYLAAPGTVESTSEPEYVDTGIVINSETTEAGSVEETVVEVVSEDLTISGEEAPAEEIAEEIAPATEETEEIIASEEKASEEMIVPEQEIIPENAEEVVTEETPEGEVVPEDELLGKLITLYYRSADESMGSVTVKEQIGSTILGSDGSEAVPEPGHRFAYWKKDGDDTIFSRDTIIKPRTEGTYIAYFEKIEKPIVAFNMAGIGEELTPDPVLVDLGKTVATPSYPALGTIATQSEWHGTHREIAKYVLVGWDWDFSTPVNEDLTIYALWEKLPTSYTINYLVDGHGDTSIESETFTDEIGPSEVSAIADTGYYFDRWTYENAIGRTETIRTASFTPQKLLLTQQYPSEYTAHFKPSEYWLTYNLRGGELLVENPEVYTIESDDIILNNPVMDGAEFLGWTYGEIVDPQLEVKIPKGSMGDITFFANWKMVSEYATVSFYSEFGDQPDPVQVGVGECVDEPETPVIGSTIEIRGRTYLFEGWCEDPNGAYPYDFETPVEANLELFAKWTQLYTVMFYNGATLFSEIQVKSGQPAIRPQDNPRQDYQEFDYWYKLTDILDPKPYDFDTPVADNMVLMAHFHEAMVEINYVAGDHGSVDMMQEVIRVFTDYADGSTATPDEGYEFLNWTYNDEYGFPQVVSTDAKLNPPREKVLGRAITANIARTYTANFIQKEDAVIVSFNMNGHGKQIEDIVLEKGSILERPEDPEAVGYQFQGWFKDSACEVEWNFEDSVDDDLELFAKWTVYSLTVTFDMNGHGAEAPEAQIVPFTGRAAQPEFPVEGYISEEEGGDYQFDGWFMDKTGLVKYPFATTPVVVNLTIYAKWTRLNTVTFDMGGHGDQPEAQIVRTGSFAVEPATPVKGDIITEKGLVITSYYRFDGWYLDTLGAIPFFANIEPILMDTTVHAKWTKVYKVTYDYNGHGDQENFHLFTEFGSSLTKPEPDPVDPELTFNGWNFLLSPWNFETDKVYTNMTLKADWGIAGKAHLVYLSNDETMGMVIPESEYVSILGGKPQGSVAITLEGYDFINWTDADGKIVSEDANFVPKGTLGVFTSATYTANFAPVKITKTVSFDMQGHGDQVPSQEVLAGEHATVPTEYTVGDVATERKLLSTSYYRFDGWFGDAETTDPFIFEEVSVQEPLTVYAKWTRVYKVTFDYQDHGERENYSVYAENGSTVQRPDPDPTDLDYEFQGWRYFVSDWDFENDTVSSNMTLTAKWEYLGNVYITYVANDDEMGEVNPGQERLRATGKPQGSAAMPARNYEFVNWTDLNGREVSTDQIFVPTASFGIYRSTTYVANFRPIKTTFSVKFHMNGVGTAPETQEVEPGGYAVQPENPQAYGYVFEGWYSDNEFLSDFNFNAPITAETDVYAKWRSALHVKLGYYSSDVSKGTTEPVQELVWALTGTAQGSVAIPEPGYEFIDWRDENGEVVGINELFVPAKKYGIYYEEQMYTANFAGSLYIVAFDTGVAGEPIAIKSVQFGEPYGNLPHPTRAGYDFLGWYNEAGDKVISTTIVATPSDHTLYARFEQEDVKKDDAGIRVGQISREGLTEEQCKVLDDLWLQMVDQETSGILDMFDMTAIKDSVEFLPDAEYLRVVLNLTVLAPQIDSATGKITVAYDVTPYLYQVDSNGRSIESTKTQIDNSFIKSGKTLSFVLNVPASVTDKYAVVKHIAADGSSTVSKHLIKTDAEGRKIVYVTASHFSTFEMTFTSQEDPQPIPPGPTPYSGGSSTVKAGWKSLGNDQWNYMLSSGKKAIGWLQVEGLWYHFNNDGLMDFGWFLDNDGKWYYLSEEHNGYFGMMTTGWHHDKDDMRDYFLDLKTGAMYTGIHTVDDKKRSFNDKAGNAWYFGTDGRWHFSLDYSRIPLGALLK